MEGMDGVKINLISLVLTNLFILFISLVLTDLSCPFQYAFNPHFSV